METGQKVTDWKWNKAKHDAAQLLAEGELTVVEVAEQVGVERKTVYAWKKRSEFAERVRELAAELGDIALRRAVANRSRRVAWLDNRLQKMRRVIDDRALDPDLQTVPGGPTGLLVRTVKMIGSGDAAERVEEYEVDTALLKEMREHEKQAAQELGQWIEKQQVEGGLTLEIVEEIIDGNPSEAHPAAPGAGGVPQE